jgi:hypothetical protein
MPSLCWLLPERVWCLLTRGAGWLLFGLLALATLALGEVERDRVVGGQQQGT